MGEGAGNCSFFGLLESRLQTVSLSLSLFHNERKLGLQPLRLMGLVPKSTTARLIWSQPQSNLVCVGGAAAAFCCSFGQGSEMKGSRERIAAVASRIGLDTALFFLLFYLYVWLVVDPRLIHHSLGVATRYCPFSFHTGWVFLREHLARPGGVVEYVSRFLTQLYCIGWVGALIVTSVAWCTCRCVDVLGACAGRPRGHFLRYAPAGLLLAMCGAYNHPLNAVLSLLAALAAFMLYVRLAPRRTTRRLFVLVFVWVALYHVAGSGSLLFPVMAAIYDLSIARQRFAAVVALFCGFAVPWMMSLLPGLDTRTAYAGFLTSDPGIWPPHRWVYTLALYLLFPAVLAGTVAWCRAFRTAKGITGGFSHPSPCPLPVGERVQRTAIPFAVLRGQAALHGPHGRLFRIASTAAAFLAVAEVAALSLDRFSGSVLEIDYHGAG